MIHTKFLQTKRVWCIVLKKQNRYQIYHLILSWTMSWTLAQNPSYTLLQIVSSTTESGWDNFTDSGSSPIIDPSIPRVLIVDAMVVLLSMKNTSSVKILWNLQNAFIKRIEGMVIGFKESRVNFDRYFQESLKNKTRKNGPLHRSNLKFNLAWSDNVTKRAAVYI